jgi:hypothetical protein
VEHPASLACQDLTGATLEPPPVIFYLTLVLLYSIKMIFMEASELRPNAPAHRERPDRSLSG